MNRYIEYEPIMAELEREIELADDWKTAHEIANVVKYAPSIEIALADDGTLLVEVKDATKVKRVLVEDGESGDLYYADRPQGEWTYAGVLTVHCSNCKSEFHELEAMNFCPYCGARMKGADDE